MRVSVSRGLFRVLLFAQMAAFLTVPLSAFGEKLSPKIRVLPLKEASNTIPLQSIGPFLNNSKVLSEKEASEAPSIISLEGEHIVAGKGDRAFIRRLPSLHEGSFYVVRKGQTHRSPITSAVLGVEVELLGQGHIEEVSSDVIVLRITDSLREIKIGDQIIPVLEERIEPYFTPQRPKNEGRGAIISVFGGVNQIGQHQVITITGGKDCGREPGDLLSVYQKQKDVLIETQETSFLSNKKPEVLRIPHAEVGEVMVSKVFDKVSFALVVKATNPIYLLDEVARP